RHYFPAKDQLGLNLPATPAPARPIELMPSGRWGTLAPLFTEEDMTVRLKSSPARTLLLSGISALSLVTAIALGQAPDVLPAGWGKPAWSQRGGGQPCPCPPAPYAPVAPPQTAPGQPEQLRPPAQPGQPTPEAAAESPSVQLGAEGMGARDTGTVAFAAPTMIGDLGAGTFARQVIVTPIGVSTNGHPQFAVSNRVVPLPGRGAFKIEENESPRPLDRVFVSYNYFNSVGLPGTPSYDLHREVAGFEKAFF